MTDEPRRTRRGLALGAVLVFGAVLAAITLVPGLAAARESAGGSSGRTTGAVQTANSTRPAVGFAFRGGFFGRFGGLGGGDAVETTADLTGTTTDDVRTALEGGQTLADYAAEHGVSESDLVAAIVAAESAEIDAKVADGTLTQDEADTLKANLTDRVTELVNQAGDLHPFGGPGPHGGHMFDRGLAVQTTADLTGTTTDDVHTALEGGQTLAEYASAHGVTETALVDGIVAAESAQIDAKVADGTLTQETADSLKADLNDRVTEQVNSAGGSFGCPGMDREETTDNTDTQST